MKGRLATAVAMLVLAPGLLPPAAAAATAQADTGGGVRIDLARLVRDPDYAARMLPSIDANAAAARGTPAAEVPIQVVRALALVGVGRNDDARAAVRRVIELAPSEPDPYPLLWYAAARLRDELLLVDVFGSVERNVAPADRQGLFQTVGLEPVFMLSHRLRESGNDEQRYRLAELLVAMGWPGPLDPGSRDMFATMLLEHRLEQGRVDEAAQLARSLTTPRAVVPLLVLKRYDGLLAADAPTALIERLIPPYDEISARALRARPDDLGLVLRRAQFLRSIGRSVDALAVLEPHLDGAPERYVEQDDLLWIANEAAYALLDLDRRDEAIAVMEPLIGLEMEAVPELIGPSINYAQMLWEAGRPAETLAHAERLEALGDRFANPFGRMWIDSAVACALSALGDDAEAAARRAAMEPRSEDNPAALMRAYLCAGELDTAERLMIARLESDDPEPMLRALQDYLPVGEDSGPEALLLRRLLELRSRPAVQAAIARVGRVLQLPLARTYYGGF